MKLVRWLNVLVILGSFVAYSAPFVSPEIFWPVAFFGIAGSWLFFFNFLFVFYWIFKKNRYFLMSLCCIIMGWNHLTNLVAINRSNQTGAIQVISYNAHGFKTIRHKDKKINKKRKLELLDFLQSAHPRPDIFCGQEITNNNVRFLENKMGFTHNYKISNRTTAILSRHPFLNKGEISFPQSANSTIWADVLIKKDTIRVYSVHLQSTKVSAQTEKVIAEVELREKETWRSIHSILAKVKRASQQRAKQAEKIAVHISQSPYPVIICGDFNDTPLSYAYQQLSAGLKDNFREKGSGIGTTYAGSIPGLRIDFILTHPKFRVDAFKRLKGAYSDHYPVFSSLTLK